MLTKPPHAPPTVAAASESSDDGVPSERPQAIEAGAGVDVLIDRLYEPPMLPTQPDYATWLAATAAAAHVWCKCAGVTWACSLAALPKYAVATRTRLAEIAAELEAL